MIRDEAVAESWASIDGELDEFRAGKISGDPAGTYEGYMSEAQELIRRMETRGYEVVKKQL